MAIIFAKPPFDPGEHGSVVSFADSGLRGTFVPSKVLQIKRTSSYWSDLFGSTHLGWDPPNTWIRTGVLQTGSDGIFKGVHGIIREFTIEFKP